MKHKEPNYMYKNIMLLDDDDLVNFINQKVMESCHFSKNIYVNTSAKSALEFLHNIALVGNTGKDLVPEVIFIDLNMPLMDGFQFIQALLRNKNEDIQNIKLVILTSSVHEMDRIKAKEISDNIAFLNKPLTKEMLERISVEKKPQS
jgi:CheY-like chemotaxis protein